MPFHSIVIEGGDQVGKGDVTHYLLKNLCERNVPIRKLSFPLYSSPFGAIVRKTLEQGFVGIPKVEKTIGTKRELELKMVSYALNRLEALESILGRFQNSEGYFLLDRSTYSLALTIAYGLGGVKSISKDEVSGLIETGLSFEKLFVQTLDMDKCVLHLMADYGKEGWKKTRTDGDLYEKKEVQEVADDVYNEIANIVGSGWNRVYTKEKGEFRNRNVIYAEVYQIVDTLNLPTTGAIDNPIYDIREVASDVYNVDITDFDLFKKYSQNIKEDNNDKNKETYQFAYKIAQYIVDNTEKVTFRNKDVKKNVKDLLDFYPEMFDLIRYHFNDDFVEKIKEGIYD
jgi:thymidylate kinase